MIFNHKCSFREAFRLLFDAVVAEPELVIKLERLIILEVVVLKLKIVFIKICGQW